MTPSVQRAVVQIRLNRINSTLIEIGCIVVCRVTCGDLDVVGLVSCIRKIQRLYNILALKLPNRIVIKRYIYAGSNTVIITGQDGDEANLKNIVDDTQTMTVYKNVSNECVVPW